MMGDAQVAVGRGPRGLAAALPPLLPPPPLATHSPRAYRLPPAGCRAHSSPACRLCARTLKGWGRLESRRRAGWGQSSHVGCCGRRRDPSVLSTACTGRSVPSRVTMKTSLSVCSQLRFAWPGMARGKIWPGDLDSVTLGARPGVSGLGGFPPCENSDRQNHSFCVHHTSEHISL